MLLASLAVNFVFYFLFLAMKSHPFGEDWYHFVQCLTLLSNFGSIVRLAVGTGATDVQSCID